MRIIAIALQAGGVGKTTLTHNLGALLAERGRRVLAVDTDGQCNLTEVLGVDPGDGPSVFQVLVAQDDQAPVPIRDAVQPVKVRENLFLLPGSPKMGRFDASVADREHREFLLRDALSGLADDEYDYVLIDCPPGLGFVLTNALLAAHEVLIPVFTRQRRTNALPVFLRVAQRSQRFNPDLRVAGIVPNHYDARNTHDRAALGYIQRFAEKHQLKVFPPIPPTIRISEAEARHLPLCDYDRTPAAATALEQLAEMIDTAPVSAPVLASPLMA